MVVSGMRGKKYSDLTLLIDDPNNSLIKIEIQNSSGKAISIQGTSIGGGQRTYNYESIPRQELQLGVYLATPASIKLVPFKLENIPLP